MSMLKPSLLLMVIMLGSALVANAMQPSQKLVQLRPSVDLERTIPARFADWKQADGVNSQIVDPQQAETIARIYSQTLSRTYRDASGYQVMLSIAYSDDQRDSVSLHYPEVCYPAQGFRVSEKKASVLGVGEQGVEVTQLLTARGRRVEPVTYWTLIGDQVYRGKIEKKLVEMQYGLKGFVADGLIFRVSSIDSDSARAYDMQAKFVGDLLADLGPASRLQLSGLVQ